MAKISKWNNIIHRDLGYLLIGMTIVYAVSGFLLNHKHDWNPNYRITRAGFNFTPVADLAVFGPEKVNAVLGSIGEQLPYKRYFRPQPETLQVFYPDRTLTMRLDKGLGETEWITKRKILLEMNSLHLNLPKKIWTWFADFYAFGLLILAITGLFVLKGKKGIKGRGAWLTLAGIIVPVIFMIFYMK